MKFPARQSREAGFTLLEAMFAVIIFAGAMVVIFDLTTQGLRGARMLQMDHPSPSIIAADFYARSELEEGSDSGDFGDAFPNSSWTAEVIEEAPGLYVVDIFVTEHFGNTRSEQTMSIKLFRPETGRSRGLR